MNAPSKTEVEAPYVLREDKDGVATLTLNRGDRMNPLSTAMLSALQAELGRLAKDTAARVVVLAGAGQHFCAGHDLREMRSHPDKAWQKALFEQCSEMMLSLVRLPQPVVARVQGVAVAAGCQLVSMCDLAVASEVAQFALPGIKSGIFCTTPGVGVARNLGRKRALEMLFTGDLIDAKTALAWGLVNRVAPLAELDAEVDRLARKIVAHSSAVVSLGKRFFYEQVEKGLADAYSLATEGMACNMMLEDTGEGIDAFIQKRRPDWPSRIAMLADRGPALRGWKAAAALPFASVAMHAIGRQFVYAETIAAALRRAERDARGRPARRFSFDMLGEGARTAADADRNFRRYMDAIRAMERAVSAREAVWRERLEVSVKLSSIHPRYDAASYARDRGELLDRLKQISGRAAAAGIGLTIDAEGTESLSLQLDLL